MAKAGRKLIKIDWETVEKLCMLACTGEEIADFLDISYDTLDRALKREKKCDFADYYKKHSAKGNISLRRTQFELAVTNKNVTMCIWLGKQRLGQKEPDRFVADDATDIAEAIATLAQKLPN